MEFSDFMLLRKGWNGKLIYEQSIARRVTEIIASCIQGSDKVHMKQWWPLSGDSGSSDMVEWKGAMISKRQRDRIVQLIEKNKNG